MKKFGVYFNGSTYMEIKANDHFTSDEGELIFVRETKLGVEYPAIFSTGWQAVFEIKEQGE